MIKLCEMKETAYMRGSVYGLAVFRQTFFMTKIPEVEDEKLI